MSYVEHGPRIFLAGRPNSGIIYGDYVLPKKRSEGRLKLHESCTDIRSWSPNILENSRYFRELAEHAQPTGKIIPFDVIVDSIIGVTSQAQNELYVVRRELQNYKSLKLSAEQEEQLLKLGTNNHNKENQSENSSTNATFPKDKLLSINNSISPRTKSFLSILIRSQEDFQDTQKDTQKHRTPLDIEDHRFSRPCGAFKTESLKDNDRNLSSAIKSARESFLPGDYAKKSTIDFHGCADVSLQVENETREIAVQFDTPFEEDGSNKHDVGSLESKTRLIESRSDIETEVEEYKIRANQNLVYESSSNDSQDFQSQLGSISDTKSENEFLMRKDSHKGIIIQKDSEIIALENELCVKDMDLEELRESIKKLESLLNQKDENAKTLEEELKTSHDKLIRMDEQSACKLEDLNKKLYGYKYLVEQLKEDLNEKNQGFYLQSQEIERLRECLRETQTLKNEKESLIKKLRETEKLVKDAESYAITLDRFKYAVREKDELKKQNQEQSCILADQEDEIKRLLVLINEMSSDCNEQSKTEGLLKELQTELKQKDIEISNYAEQLISMQNEIGKFFNNLKNCLNSLDEISDPCEDTNHSSPFDFDMSEEAHHLLHNINAIMLRFQSYKLERQDFVQRIRNLERAIESSKRNNSLRHSRHVGDTSSDQDFIYESNQQDGIGGEVPLNMAGNKENRISSEMYDENVFNTTDGEYLLNLALCREDIKNMDYNDAVEREIIEQSSYYMIKMQSIMQKFQAYVEVERPTLIKQIHNFYQTIKDAVSAITSSHDATLRKQRIAELYNLKKDENKKRVYCEKDSPDDLQLVEIEINQYIEALLRQQLEDISHLEKRYSYDKRIDDIFKMYFEACIDKLNVVFQGAGDHCMITIEELKNQEKEIAEKDTEIARLKAEVAQHMARKGEGDCLRQAELEEAGRLKELLLKVTGELSEKNAAVYKLREQIQVVQKKFSACSKDCNALRKQNKNLDNIKNRFARKCRENDDLLILRNKEIETLSKQIQDLAEAKDIMTIMEDKMQHLEKKLHLLHNENDKLRDKLVKLNNIILEKDESIINLKNNVDKNDNALSCKINEFNAAMEEKDGEISRVKDENESLSRRLKDAENKVIEMNNIILSLTEENDKINVIYVLQENLVKLDKSERKLKAELNNLKTQLTNNESINTKLENQLEEFHFENENLRRTIEYWKNVNCQLSKKALNPVLDENSRDILYNVSNKLFEKVLIFKQQLNTRQDINNQVNHLPNHENISIIANEVKSNNFHFKNGENKELEESCDKVEENGGAKDNCVELASFNIFEDNAIEMRRKLRHLENVVNQKQEEIKKILVDVEVRDAEIKTLKETVTCLMQEKAELQVALKTQLAEYQGKLTLMKKNYDSSVNSLCERHRESVERLQTRYEDNMTDERGDFDSESWLQSLSIKDLIKLHERICMFNSCVIMKSEPETVHADEKNENDTRNARKKMKLDAPDKLISEVPSPKENQQFLYPHCQQMFKTKNQNQSPKNRKLHEYKKYDIPSPDDLRTGGGSKTMSDDKKATKKDDKYDIQRWNFINQCSAYHKLN